VTDRLGHSVLAPAGVESVDRRALERALRRQLRGEVHFDAGNRAAYAHDSSNYRQPPLGIVLPRDADDVVAAVAACREHGAPVLNRGCGTSLSGETTNVAVVIDMSRHMRAIREIDPERRIARVEPGVVHDQLTGATEPRHALTFAPDTSTHAFATIGGMLGNNSCGVHSVMGGRTSDNTVALDVLTYDGQRMRVGSTSEDELARIAAAGGRRGEIYAALRALRDRHADRIRERFPKIPRRVSGYNLDELLPERGFDVARALVGTEGTCVSFLEATLRLIPSPPARCLVVLGYPDVFAAGDHVPEVMELEPIALEAFDDRLVGGTPAGLPPGRGWLVAEFGGEAPAEAEARARECVRRLERQPGAPAIELVADRAGQRRIWELRGGGLGATAYARGDREHWPGWEDAAVPPGREGAYLRDFKKLLDAHGYSASLYGHFGQGCIHCRIDFELRTREGVERWRSFLGEAADLVVSYGGSLSGEHGDGQARAELLPKMFGEDLVQAFGEFKAIWDPGNRMNPHKVVDPYPIVSNMKLGADFRPPEPGTHFAFAADGGSFARATVRCVGAGSCRDTSTGTMCPSFMVTHDERHTTRGRARILYEMLEGGTIRDGFRSEDVRESLDLCLGCKGCRSECPVSVDMATYKAEFLAKHYARRLRPREAYALGLVMAYARLAARVPRLANALTQTPVLRGVVKRAAGVSARRALPRFAPETFRSWFRRRAPVDRGGAPVVLFADTFSNFIEPEPAKAAVAVLEAAGRRVIVPEGRLCCGRPLYDYGMLDTAKRLWRRNLDALAPYVRDGIPVVVLEPSCAAAFRDELVGLFPDDERARLLHERALTLAELLEREAPEWAPPRLGRRAVVHGHCQQKAVIGLDAERRLYDRLGLDFEVLDSGCCGMAGSFGLTARHYDLSVAIGERRLLPAVRAIPESTLLIADGFSCRSQVSELTDRRPLHTAEVVRTALGSGHESGHS
jgi:FAD/FMN-containing dehydrogenase/Fe-S oxidoreductase